MELAQSYIKCENPILSIQYCKLSRIILALAYMLCCLSAIQSQLEMINQSLSRVSIDSSVLLKNTKNKVQLKQLIIRLAKYNIPTSLIYKCYRKKKFKGFCYDLSLKSQRKSIPIQSDIRELNRATEQSTLYTSRSWFVYF